MVARRGALRLASGISLRTFGLSAVGGGTSVARQTEIFGPMVEEIKDVSGDHMLRSSSLYREFQAEREEILKHKWIESEKAGHDIGFERALTDWIVKHRSKWRKERQAAASQSKN
jgi:hypothetical protein